MSETVARAGAVHHKQLLGMLLGLVVLLSIVTFAPRLQHNLLFLKIAVNMVNVPVACQIDFVGDTTPIDARSAAFAAYACGRFTEAAALFSGSIGNHAYTPLTRYFRLESLIKAGDQTAAVAALQDAETKHIFERNVISLQDKAGLALVVKAGTVAPMVYYTLGELTSAEQPVQAADYYKRGLLLDRRRDTAPAQLAAAYVARQQHDWSSMQQAYAQAVQYASDGEQRCRILNEVASATMFDQKDGDQALGWAQQLRSLCPWLIDGWLHAIYFNAYLGHGEQALLWYAEAQKTQFGGSPALEDARTYVLQNK